MHGDGRGVEGCEVVAPPLLLTEEDARQIIEEEFKKENIVFDRKDMPVEGIVFEQQGYDYTTQAQVVVKSKFVLDGFSSAYNLGYEFVSMQDYAIMSPVRLNGLLDQIDTKSVAEGLRGMLEKHGRMNAVVFYDPMPEYSYADYQSGKKFHEDSIIFLKAQVADFIDWLKKNVKSKKQD